MDDLPDQQAGRVADMIIGAMSEVNLNAFVSLSIHLGELGEQSKPAQVAAGSRHIVAAMTRPTADLVHTDALMMALAGIEPAQITTLVAKTAAPMRRSSLCGALISAVPFQLEEVTPAKATYLAEQITKCMAMCSSDVVSALVPFGYALGYLQAILPEDQVLRGAKLLIAAMGNTNEISVLKSLAEAFESLRVIAPTGTLASKSPTC